MNPYPLLFQPLLKERVWGGDRLAQFGKPVPAGKTIGESWELADLPSSIPDGRSRIANGSLAGLTLREAITAHHKLIMGAAKLTPEGGFPLLIKLLDARDNLSVQVHPTAKYAAAHPGSHLKSEAWVIMQAEPGSVIYNGFDPGVTRESFAEHLRSGDIRKDLRAVQAVPGECHYLPSGTCHALGAGILVAEIQTPSDTTFRVYDWGRTGRELHVNQALECIDFTSQSKNAGSISAHPRPMEGKDFRWIALTQTEFFELERIEAHLDVVFDLVTNHQPEAWMMLEGSAHIHSPLHDDLPLARGATVLLPAALENASITLSKFAIALRITLPPLTKGMLA